MTSKSILKAFVALCITATLVVAMCGCDDLGVYDSTEEYYSSFGDIVLVSASSADVKECPVEDYFYNEESRENFLVDENGEYHGVDYSDYVYMAIPFDSTITMDSLALYLRSGSDVALCIDVYAADKDDWEIILDKFIKSEESEDGSDEGSDGITDEESDDMPVEGAEAVSDGESETNTEEKEYVFEDLVTKIGEVSLYLKKDKWDSFVLDIFDDVDGAQNSIEINSDQCVLLRFRNNLRGLDGDKQESADQQTALELQPAEITMTNLLIRALDLENTEESLGGE